eukprot:CAMPEP_0118666044 /NCGR_PEP_ID=MMETSP0785-20121206/18983_1 /TAXON_ID=91992 /ORGANISM="Bolidomonas pacifica, Strain CCMP 1866" /LENGTH=217 /DNA_ID=CAMNT_0006560285 /DNA_START=193 /DNA_END=843 /DNA_ORIENTATION=-
MPSTPQTPSSMHPKQVSTEVPIEVPITYSITLHRPTTTSKYGISLTYVNIPPYEGACIVSGWIAADVIAKVEIADSEVDDGGTNNGGTNNNDGKANNTVTNKDGVTIQPGDIITHINNHPIQPLLSFAPTLEPLTRLLNLQQLSLNLTLERGKRRWIYPKVRSVSEIYGVEHYDIDTDDDEVADSLRYGGLEDDCMSPSPPLSCPTWLKSRKTYWRG